MLRISNGETATEIARDYGVARSRIVERCIYDPKWADEYARARLLCADAVAEKALLIALDTSEDPHSRRVKWDALRWHASKLNPRRWGDKLEVTGDGLDGNRPILDLTNMPRDERDLLEELLRRRAIREARERVEARGLPKVIDQEGREVGDAEE